MTSAGRIAVIGGGVIGLSAAWRLAQRGAHVVLYDRTAAGTEASWAAAGMLALGGELDPSSPWSDFYLESRRLFPEFVQELAASTASTIDYQECGALELAYGDQEWATAQARSEHQRALGIASRALAPEKALSFSPHIEPRGLTGALFYPGDAVVSPRDLLRALRLACQKAGVTVREHSPVETVSLQRRCAAVQGEPFEQVIVAAGAWSSTIQAAGLPPLPAAEPVKGHLLGFDLPFGACPSIVRHGHLYLFQRSSGLLVAGSTHEHVGFDRAVNWEVARHLLAELRQIYPVLLRLEPVETWTGLRPGSDTLNLGRWHDSPVYLAYGHYRNGILLAPATGERIVRDCLG